MIRSTSTMSQNSLYSRRSLSRWAALFLFLLPCGVSLGSEVTILSAEHVRKAYAENQTKRARQAAKSIAHRHLAEIRDAYAPSTTRQEKSYWGTAGAIRHTVEDYSAILDAIVKYECQPLEKSESLSVDTLAQLASIRTSLFEYSTLVAEQAAANSLYSDSASVAMRYVQMACQDAYAKEKAILEKGKKRDQSLKLHKVYQALPPSLRAKPAAISPDSPAFYELVGGLGVVDPTRKHQIVVDTCYDLNMPAAGRAQCILRLVRLQNHIRNELETGKGFSASVKDTINRMRHLLLGTLKRETNPACRASLLITSADIMDETAAIVRRHVPKKPTKESAYVLHMANTFNENIRKNCEDDGIDTTALIKRSKKIKGNTTKLLMKKASGNQVRAIMAVMEFYRALAAEDAKALRRILKEAPEKADDLIAYAKAKRTSKGCTSLAYSIGSNTMFRYRHGQPSSSLEVTGLVAEVQIGDRSVKKSASGRFDVFFEKNGAVLLRSSHRIPKKQGDSKSKKPVTQPR